MLFVYSLMVCLDIHTTKLTLVYRAYSRVYMFVYRILAFEKEYSLTDVLVSLTRQTPHFSTGCTLSARHYRLQYHWCMHTPAYIIYCKHLNRKAIWLELELSLIITWNILDRCLSIVGRAWVLYIDIYSTVKWRYYNAIVLTKQWCR